MSCRRFLLPGLAVLATVSVAQAQTWTTYDLDPGNLYDSTFAYGISHGGRATGTGYVASTGELHALVFANGAIQDLGMLGYPYGADGVAIDDNNQILATGYGPGFHALIDSQGTLTPLMGSEAGSSEGSGLNDLGDAVGRTAGDDGGFVPFSYINGQLTLMAGFVRANAINDSDQIAGSIGFTWVYGGLPAPGRARPLDSGGVATDLGNLGGGTHTNHAALGINGAGSVVGYSTAADATIHAFLWQGGVLQDLGTIAPYYAYASAINGSGSSPATSRPSWARRSTASSGRTAS